MKENILKSLEIMWKGCLAIFIVIAIIVACVLLLTYADKKITEHKQRKLEASKTNEQNNNSSPNN